jgi:predicted metal-dependent hydrolase
VRLSIVEDGVVRITVPKRCSLERAERFLYEKSAWVLAHLDSIEKNPGRVRLPTGHLNFMRHKATARRLVMALLEELNTVYQVRYKRVSVRDQKTRWGSCSRDGRLSFSYKIVFLPPGAARYIVAHELSHLKEFNHSRKFWEWVSKSIPEHVAVRRELRKWSLR